MPRTVLSSDGYRYVGLEPCLGFRGAELHATVAPRPPCRRPLERGGRRRCRSPRPHPTAVVRRSHGLWPRSCRVLPPGSSTIRRLFVEGPEIREDHSPFERSGRRRGRKHRRDRSRRRDGVADRRRITAFHEFSREEALSRLTRLSPSSPSKTQRGWIESHDGEHKHGSASRPPCEAFSKPAPRGGAFLLRRSHLHTRPVAGATSHVGVPGRVTSSLLTVASRPMSEVDETPSAADLGAIHHHRISDFRIFDLDLGAEARARPHWHGRCDTSPTATGPRMSTSCRSWRRQPGPRPGPGVRIHLAAGSIFWTPSN